MKLALSGEQIEAGNWWVYITATFAHATWPHFLNNLIMFLIFAPVLE